MNNKIIETNSFISPNNLREMNQPVLNGKAADFSGYTFWQYTSVHAICNILNSGSFWVNNIAGMNDKREANLHKKKKNDIFIQCFCNSDTEKIPMWYLYGGIVGRGASIGFTPGVMMNYINSIQYVTELVPIPGGSVPGKRYEIGKDFELQVGWVFYTDDKYVDDKSANANRSVRVNYWNKPVNVTNASEFYKDNYFVKDLPWEYEKEFRLVFINKTGKKIDRIRVDIPEEFQIRNDRKLKVRLAPEIRSDKEFEKYRQMILSKGEKYRVVVQKSKLEINMDLLEKNRNDINDHVQKNPDYLCPDVRKIIYDYYRNNEK